jgi:hypothetical protein
MDGEHRDERQVRTVDKKVPAVRGQAGVEVESGALDGETAHQDEGAAGIDGVSAARPANQQAPRIASWCVTCPRRPRAASRPHHQDQPDPQVGT